MIWIYRYTDIHTYYCKCQALIVIFFLLPGWRRGLTGLRKRVKLLQLVGEGADVDDGAGGGACYLGIL